MNKSSILLIGLLLPVTAMANDTVGEAANSAKTPDVDVMNMRPAVAGENGQSANEARFASFDNNNDGMVSHDEIAAGEKLATTITKNWGKIDTNGDLKIDEVEFSSFEKKGNL